MRSLKYSIMLTNLIDDVGHEIILRQRDSQEPAHYCVVCDVSFLNLFLFFVQKKNLLFISNLRQIEVFNILFVKEVDRKHVVHCFYCAQKMNPELNDFVILEEYKLDELTKVYDNFQLITTPAASTNLNTTNSSNNNHATTTTTTTTTATTMSINNTNNSNTTTMTPITVGGGGGGGGTSS